MKYKRFIDAVGGWDVLQAVLAALAEVARRHGVSVANVATRWVLEQPAVAAVIVGARLGESEHRADNLRLFSFALDEEDHARIDAALAHTTPHSRRLRRRVSAAALPDCLGRSQPPSRAASRRSTRRRRCRPHRPAARSIPAASGSRSRLQPGRARRRPHPGQRHHRDPRQRRGGLPGRSAWPDRLYPRQDRGQPRALGGVARGRRAHAHLCPRRQPMGAGRPRPWPALRRRCARPTRWSRPG